MEVHIPHDVVLNHILPRVPAKSVCRFKCVSKEWLSFLSSDMFINEHNRHLDHHKNNLKLLLMSKTETSFEFTTIDCEAPPSDKGLTPTHRPLPPFGGTTPYHIHVLTSFHGLVCLGIMMYIRSDVDQYSDLILWNPLTNEYKRLSESNIYKECDYRELFFQLYYSSDEDDYKLLLVKSFDENVYIYSLRLDSWREVDDAFQLIGRIYPGALPSRGTYLNGDLYFVRQELGGRLWSIIKFDTKNELFLEIQTPNVYVDSNPDNEDNSFATIVVISDCIHVCVKYDTFTSDSCCESTISIKLWKLDEDEDMKEVLTYQLRPLPYDDHDSMNYLIPFHLMKNGNWLMLMNSSSYNHRIYEVRLKKKMHMTNKGKEEEKGGKIYDDFEYANVRLDSTNINELVDKEVGYIETFVSPNRYMK